MTPPPASPPGPVDLAAHWPVDALDLDAYLRRVGHRGPVTPDGATLRALHRAHVAAITSGLLEPLPLVEDAPRRQGRWEYRLRRGPDGAWRLRERATDDWVTVQTFTEEPQYPVDVEVANHHTATDPRSPFTRQRVVVRKDDESVRRLIDRAYTWESPGHPTRCRTLTDEEYADALVGEFALTLSEDEIRALVNSLPPPDADAAVAPDLELRSPTGGHRA
ncbi:arylamine N-acetyltransferase [Micromonospora sp. NPDC051300]|uniref:arylamine N-acetyltransferase n=1 Tax=Micromonospora sp. NPDC051300 TaxID=3364286 RepID=UPI0037A38812